MPLYPHTWSGLAPLLLLAAVPAQSGLKIQPDKENVVASRLIGRWQLDATLTARLGGNSTVNTLEFRQDDAVVDKIPEPIAQKLKTFRIYLAGFMELKGQPQAFILVEHKGNPHVVWFRERGGDPMGDAESFNVLLARAAQLNGDLLFVGGDHVNQPFTAFGRARGPEDAAPADAPEASLKAALADMSRLLTSKNYKELITTYAEPKDLERIQKDEGGLDKLAEAFGKDKAERLLKLVDQVKGTAPTFNDDRTEATFKAAEESRPLKLKRIDKRWYLQN